MPPHARAIEAATARGRAAVATIGRELDLAIRRHGLSYTAVGGAVGLSGSQVGRVARGRSPELTVVQASRLLAAVGLELSIRSYPTGEPLRDAAHLALLARLRAHLHASLAWRTEVPLARNGDLRAWDAVIRAPTWSVGVEAETRPSDLQALERRLALKQRDGEMPTIVLLLADTRHNRAIVAGTPDLADRYPVRSRAALASLEAGADPGGSALILL